MCGQEVPMLRKITIEGSILSVCSNCVKFGQDYDARKGPEELTYAGTIDERLHQREKKLKTRDVFEESKDELALDYPNRIRNARVSKGLNQDDLAKKINEKKSVVAKLENGDMIPDNKLIRKLEYTLDISLKEKFSKIETPKQTSTGKKMTLGDFIKVEKE
jgi:putative transcription factor